MKPEQKKQPVIAQKKSIYVTALGYSVQGWPVFPLIPNEKKPAVENGFKAASLDGDQITEWFANDSTFNIGIPTGSASGVWVLDLDNKNGVSGDESLSELEKEFGPLPATRTCFTANGGRHLYFNLPKGVNIRNRTNVRPGIDVRGEGGYCVAPPSAIQGRDYQWLDFAHPIADAPEQWVEMVCTKADPTKVSLPAIDDNSEIAAGSRNDFLQRIISQKMHEGEERETVTYIALGINSTKCTPPLDESEVRTIVDNVFRLYQEEQDYHCSDTGNAKLLASLVGQDTRYVVEVDGWLRWNGHYWGHAHKYQIIALTKQVSIHLHERADRLPDSKYKSRLKKHALDSENTLTIQHMIEVFKAEPGIAVSMSDLDQCDDFFPLKNGLIDLNTGEFVPAQKDFLVTQVSEIDFDVNATCPRWEKFIAQICADDPQLISYIQRAIGYSLTASIQEHCLFFLYGYGANGKSTFLNILRALMGQLGAQVAGETLLTQTRTGSGPSPDVARLIGKRLAAVSEVDDGKQFSEGLLKTLTGGDSVTARLLYTQPITFKPIFKLWLAANHKPTIKGSGFSIWRRMRLIPFTVTFKKEDQDPYLEKTLLSELPGILNWAVKGCMDWKQNGLPIPDAVAIATDEYRKEMDVIGSWLSEFCVEAPGLETPFSTAYKSYQPWGEENYNWAYSKRQFGLLLKERGFEALSKPHRAYRGFAMRENMTDQQLKKYEPSVEIYDSEDD